jgi:hypothetical protein
MNQLKQIGLAFLNHEAAHGHLPTGGWSHKWVGDPDRGFGKDQPGSWPYNILPFMEQQALHDLGADGQPDVITQQQKEQAAITTTTPLEQFHCPSRRAAALYPGYWVFDSTTSGPFNATNTELIAKTDYAACAGTAGVEFNAANSEGFLLNDWQGPEEVALENGTEPPSGVCYQRSMIELRQITDGTSSTYMVGEKFMDPDFYEGMQGIPQNNDHHGVYSYGWDQTKSANQGWLPWQDKRVLPNEHFINRAFASSGKLRFGSAHPGVWLMTFCDGSVQSLSFEMDGQTHFNYGNRHDGQVVEGD